MSSDHVAVALVQTVKCTHSQSNNSRVSVELESHADTCAVGSNVLVVCDRKYFIYVYDFDKETRHPSASTTDVPIAYKDPDTHLNVILTIDQATKINSMHNILICPMQCQVHGTIVNE